MPQIKEYLKTQGELISEMRSRCSMTQNDVAAYLWGSTRARAKLSYMESGRRALKVNELMILCDLFRCKIEELIPARDHLQCTQKFTE